MKELLEHIEKQKSTFAKLHPLSRENQQRLDKKFRLEWNYNSNHIEGNTLTYGETELLLIFEQSKGQHDVREFDEMRGHDIALRLITELATDIERELTEKFIREINQIILARPFYKEALTADRQPTRRLIKIGEYKSFHNSVILQNGEMFHYPSPTDTPILMEELMTWYHTSSKDGNNNPVEIAAEFHYRFVSIHPFDDGNGRIARLLMNYHLLKTGYPPAIIKSADKKNYLFALHEADTGNIEAFKIYIAEQLVWSYEISIRAAKGESIDEAGDWEKKVEILKKQTSTNPKATRQKNKETIIDLFKNSFTPLINKLLSKVNLLEPLYLSSSFTLSLNSNKIISQKTFEDMTYEVPLLVDDATDRFLFNQHLSNFKQNGTGTFDSYYTIQFYLSTLTYTVSLPYTKEKEIRKVNEDYLTEEEIDSIVSIITENIHNQIQKNLNNTSS